MNIEHVLPEFKDIATEPLNTKLITADIRIKDLQSVLVKKIAEAQKMQLKIEDTLLKKEQRPAINSTEQKLSKKTKGIGFLNFIRRKNEKEIDNSKKDMSKSVYLNEIHVLNHLDLVYCKENLCSSIHTTIEVEKQMQRFSKGIITFTNRLKANCKKSFIAATSNESRKEIKRLVQSKKKDSDILMNEWNIKEFVHARLLRKQITSLENEIKASTTSLQAYEKNLKNLIPRPMFFLSPRFYQVPQ